MSDERPMALSVELVRHEMLRGILIPRELVNEALQTTAAKLRAKETKFFAHKGVVVSARDVEDHTTQLTAADQIYSLAGLYARERSPAPQAPTVALEVDPTTGVIRLLIGTPTNGSWTAPEAPVLPSAAETPIAILPPRPKRVPIPTALHRIVLDEIVDA